MKRKLRVGVFGGYQGKLEIHALLNHPDAELVAVCDMYEPLLKDAKEMAENFGVSIATFTDFDSFIRFDMDAVILANYATEHAPYAIRCLNSGKHVLSAMLPVQTMAQAVELVETVERTGLVYAYDENYCYRPDTFEMWKRYKAGAIGEAQYAMGEYIHDSMNTWPLITYGDKNHWRNRMYCTYYCTHSLGPLMTITGLRPKSVIGFEIKPDIEEQKQLGLIRGPGMLVVTMENGSIFKTVDGPLKREPGSVVWEVYGTKGVMQTGRGTSYAQMAPFSAYQEGEMLCVGHWEEYNPQPSIVPALLTGQGGPGGSNFYPAHFFIEKILGRENGKWSIDVYQALDMAIPGILGYYSVLDGNKAYEIPNFRNPEEREKWRYDNRCTDPNVAGPGELLPTSSYGDRSDVPEETYENIRKLWENKQPIMKINREVKNEIANSEK